MKSLNLQQMEDLRATGWGQRTMDCITGTYSNKGWASVGVWVLTAFIPETSVGMAVGCAVKNY